MATSRSPTRRDGEELLRRTRIGSVVTAKAPPKRERKWVPEKRKRDGTWGVACLGAPAEAASRGAWRGDDACGDEATQRNEEDDERMLGWALSENGCRPISSQDVRPTLLDHKRDCGRRAAHDIWALTGLLTCVIVSLFCLPHVLWESACHVNRNHPTNHLRVDLLRFSLIRIAY